MKKGKQVGEYSSGLTSIRVIANDEGKSLIEMSFEGKSATGPTGFDFIGTVTCLAGKTGTYKYQGAVYLENGDIHSSAGEGKYERLAHDRWRNEGSVARVDGSAHFIDEGEMNLTDRTWNGKIFEIES